MLGFGKFLAALKGQIAQLTKAADKFMDKSLFKACMAAVVITGWSDGDFDTSEKMKGLKLAKTHPMFKGKFSADEVKDVFEEYDDVFTMDFAMGKTEAMKAISAVSGKDPEAKALVVQTMCLIGAADGNFDDDEKRVAKEVCGVLGLRPSQFEL